MQILCLEFLITKPVSQRL